METTLHHSTHMVAVAPPRCPSSTRPGRPPDERDQTPRHSSGRTGTSYDAIVVGGGHNGLTNAAYLAK